MDIESVSKALQEFIRAHHKTFYLLTQRETQLLEIGAMVLCVEHYKLKGYEVTPVNSADDLFRVKTTAQGKPWNFSWFSLKKDDCVIEVHANLPVRSFFTWDHGVYVVDVAVIHAGRIPKDRKLRKTWEAVDNEDLITFIECKKLVVYPMLLAQFVGIVHEIKRDFLGHPRNEEFESQGHFNPSLISVGRFSGTSQNIVEGFRARNFRLNIIAEFDHKLAAYRYSQRIKSPFED